MELEFYTFDRLRVMRTNIDIDDRLMKKAQRASGLKTKRAIVEAGLQLLVRVKEQEEILRLAGKVHWDGDLDQSRQGAVARRGHRVAARPQRGTNARMIEEILQSSAPRALRPAEIRSALQRDKGVAMPLTSIRHALGQLEARHTVEQVPDSKTWRWGVR